MLTLAKVQKLEIRPRSGVTSSGGGSLRLLTLTKELYERAAGDAARSDYMAKYLTRASEA